MNKPAYDYFQDVQMMVEELKSRDETIKAIATERDRALGKVELLLEQYAQAQRRIAELIEEIARLKAKGE